MFASLASVDTDEEQHLLKDLKTRCTTGSVVSSLYHLKDTEGDGEFLFFFGVQYQILGQTLPFRLTFFH